MSLIDQSIKILTIMVENREIKPGDVPAFLEQVHTSLLAMFQKEQPIAEVAPETIQVVASQAPTEVIQGPSADNLAETSVGPSTAPKVSDSPRTSGVKETSAPKSRRKPLTKEASAPKSRRKPVAKVVADTIQVAVPHAPINVIPEPSDDGLTETSVSTNTGDVESVKDKPVSQASKNEAQPAPEIKTATVQPAAMIANNYSVDDKTVTCMECGLSMKSLKLHLKAAHGLDEHQYRKSFELPLDFPLVAPALSRRLKENNAKLGLYGKMQQAKKAKGETGLKDILTEKHNEVALLKTTQTDAPSTGMPEDHTSVGSTSPVAKKRAYIKRKVSSPETKTDAAQTTKSISPIDAVKDDAVTCLKCGAVMKLLKRHLWAAHQMDEHQYRKAFGLPNDYPLVSPALSRQRKARNSQLGLAEKMNRNRKDKLKT